MTPEEALALFSQSRPPGHSCVTLQDLQRALVTMQNVIQQITINIIEDGVPAADVPKIIGGLTTGTVSSGATTFNIDTIISFTPGYTHGTSPQVVTKFFGGALADNQPVLAIHCPDDDTWYAFFDTDTDTGGGGGGTYLAGYGLQLTGGDTFRLDNTNYQGDKFELPGSLNDGTFTWNTVSDWLIKLTNFNSTPFQALVHNSSSSVTRWSTATFLEITLP